MDPYAFEPNHAFIEVFSKAMVGFAKRYNRYEIKGFDKVPQDKPCIFVFYHGFMPVDMFYFGMSFYQLTGTPICALVAREGMIVPGVRTLFKNVGAVAGSRSAAKKVLESGHSLGVAPGGLWEAISGHDNDYVLQWGDRSGFASVAIETGATIYPAFSENVESMYKNPLGGTELVKSFYNLTKLPLTPFLGLGPLPFPVKVTTHIGEAIAAKAGETPTELAARTKTALQSLMNDNQAGALY